MIRQAMPLSSLSCLDRRVANAEGLQWGSKKQFLESSQGWSAAVGLSDWSLAVAQFVIVHFVV